MNDVKVTAKIYNLDKPTHYSRRLYTKEALEKAFNNDTFIEQNEKRAIPIMTEEGDIVGTAHCSLNYPTIDIEGVINERLESILNDTVLTPAGCGHLEYDKTIDMHIVKDYKLCELVLSNAAYFDCSMEVVKE